jgi:hypothetical protein
MSEQCASCSTYPYVASLDCSQCPDGDTEQSSVFQATDVRRRRGRPDLDIRSNGRGLFVPKGFGELLEEQRHAVIKRCGGTGRFESFCDRCPTLSDQFLTIRR